MPGPGAEVGEAIAAHPGVDKIAFTGETATGRRIAEVAAQTLKRVSLELGGKSPNIVFADADLDAAVIGSLWAIYYSAGQSCEARSRILVQDERVRRVRIGLRREGEGAGASAIRWPMTRRSARSSAARTPTSVRGFVDDGRGGRRRAAGRR